MANADNFYAHGLLLKDKPLKKTESLVSQTSSSKPLTKTRTLGPKKSSKKPSSTANADIFCANKLLLIDKPLTKTESLLSQKSSSKPSSMDDAEIFTLHRLLLPQKPLTKTRSLGPQNHPRTPVLLLTLTSSAYIDYSWQKIVHENWVPAVQKIILKTQFYRWRWNLQCI